MILDKTITIQTCTITKDSEGYDVATWSTIATLRANRQPYIRERAKLTYEESGISNSEIIERFFVKPNSYIELADKSQNTRIVENGDTFTIVRALKYNLHYEVICKPTKQ